MKRLLIMLCLIIVTVLGLSSCAYEAYPSGGYVTYGYAAPPVYYGHPWYGHRGYHGGYHYDRGRHEGWGRGRGHYGRR